ncbi:MAG: trypsin-like serine protease [Comamonadaceae bacterium]|nr:MAG: trypsin-like serine protease [Comamonadaceae bacterium]
MRRPALYSSSSRPAHERPGEPAATDAAAPAPGEAQTKPNGSLAARLHLNNIRLLWAVVALLALLLAVSLSLSLRPGARKLTQEDINAAVIKTLETVQLPSPAARAAAAIQPSVVRVSGYAKEKGAKEESQIGVGTGVVIVDKGVILTNLHVVQGAETIRIVFADGLEATARVTGVQAENDLAVLQANKIPDDLIAATMRSTADLAPGDQVVAVGFPFGIGPSTSAGVISGLKRNFRSPEGKQMMRNLIQFDAAANPGNSGGPLVTMDGEVIGIVTAIYNPNQQRTFVGIGFAVPIENAAAAAGMPPF